MPILCDGIVSIREFASRAGVLFLLVLFFIFGRSYSRVPHVLVKPGFPKLPLDAHSSMNVLQRDQPLS